MKTRERGTSPAPMLPQPLWPNRIKPAWVCRGVIRDICYGSVAHNRLQRQPGRIAERLLEFDVITRPVLGLEAERRRVCAMRRVQQQESCC